MFTSLALIVLAGLAGPLLAAGRRPRIPVLVGELAAGVLIGRTGFDLVDPAIQPFTTFSSLGFAMLMLEAGTEVDLALIGGRALARATVAQMVVGAGSLAIGLGAASFVGAGHRLLFPVLLAGSSAAVAFPVIREYQLRGAAIQLLIAWITLADAVTALLMPLTISGATQIPVALLGDAAIIAAAAAIALLGGRIIGTPSADELERESKQRRWALRLRLSVLMLLVLAAIAEHTGASLLVAGFAAGIVLRQFRQPHRLELELTGLASGFFVPIFFVLLGATLDLRAWIRSPSAILLAAMMMAGAVVLHVVAALVAGQDHRLASGLLASAQLGLPAAAASLGLSTHTLSQPVAAALVAGGLLTLIPATAGANLLQRGMATEQRPAAAPPPAT